MARQKKLVDPQIVINNIGIKVVPNSVKYTEGFGEQKSETQTAGGGIVEKVDSEDVSTTLSKITLQLMPTAENIALARSLKAADSNVITVTDLEGFSRTFQNATLNNDFEVGLGADEIIDLEFMSESAV